MPEIADVVGATISGVFKALSQSETDQLKGQLEFVKGLAGKNLSVDDAAKLIEEGKLPDYFAAAEVDITAQMSLTLKRTSDVGAGGSVGLGNFSINATYQSGKASEETTGATVRVSAERVSKSKALDNLVSGIDDIKKLFE